ncbi:MAG: hypothetical protein GY710_15280 [Desulfobacteraceae bacterium]|nr:hypothetical protein [Desulfobacteraceae bacterium]
MLKRNYNTMRPAFSNVINTQEYLKNKIKEIDQELIDIRNEKNPRLRAEITQNLLSERKKYLLRLASVKEDNIKSIHHPYNRAYKEPFHFFKIPLIKRRPRSLIKKTIDGETYVKELTEYINFQGIELNVTYYGGELGDPDRVVWFAVMNNGIRHLEFVKEFGWIPYSRTDIARDAGLGEKRASHVSKCLEKLRLTDVKFKTPFGGFAYKGAFHMIDTIQTIGAKDLRARVKKIIESKHPVADKVLIEQAQEILGGIKPRTPKLNLISYHRNLMDAIIANHITTVDYWSVNKFSDVGEKNLYLYFYDIAQWYKSDTPKKISLPELMVLADLKLHIRKAKGKEYPEWKRAKDQIEAFLKSVDSEAKFILYWEWIGEKENTWLHIYLNKDARQIPAAPQR